MGAITFVNVLCALGGNAIFILMRLHEDQTKYKKGKAKKAGFITYWLAENRFQLIASVVVIFFMLLFAPYIFKSALGCSGNTDATIYRVYAAVVGYFNYSLWTQAMNNVKKRFIKG